MDLIGPTLARYLTVRFVRTMLGMFLTVAALIYTIDFVELMRRSGDVPGIRTSSIALLTLYRTPSVAEQILPFAVLFGAMSTMLGLSRKLELVVMRSAGVSVWEFLQPPVLVALLIGLLSVAVYNPVSARLKQQATDMEASLFGRGARAVAADLWIRQRSIDGQSIIRALSVDNQTADLKEVTFFQFDQSGQFSERVEAKSARIDDGFWELSDVRLVSANAPPESFGTYIIATNLRADQVRQAIVPPASVPFWDLPELVERTQRAGLDATRYRLQYQVLLARPLLLIAMVIIASTVSLRFFRMGGVARMVLGGVFAGFMLYVVKQLVEDLGKGGFLNVTAASWIPPVVAALVGTMILLHLEDG